MVASAGGEIGRDFLDFEVLGLGLDVAANAGQRGSEQR
jgi:hypothetical protein